MPTEDKPVAVEDDNTRSTNLSLDDEMTEDQETNAIYALLIAALS